MLSLGGEQHHLNRVYSVPCPNFIWRGVDGNDKLMESRWKVAVHGAMDGYSKDAHISPVV